MGLAVMSLHTLKMELALKRIVVLDVVGFPVLRDWHIVHREGKRLSTVAQAFKEFVLRDTTSIISVPDINANH